MSKRVSKKLSRSAFRPIPREFTRQILCAAAIAALPMSAWTAESVQVINIAGPDERGLSHNHRDQFDVNRSGTVLNNSTGDGRAILAGPLGANPNLAAGTAASTILIEVSQTGMPSKLAGPLEVFGQKAGLVIANPNGITVDGLSTLNAHSLILSTGSSQEQSRMLAARRGTIAITTAGMNTDGLQAFDMIAQYIKIHGPIGPAGQTEATRLGLYAGAYEHGTMPGQVLPLSAGRDATPATAITSTGLGAMYGASILMRVNQRGAGVALHSPLFSADDISIQANGDIVLARSMDNASVSAAQPPLFAKGKLDILAGQHTVTLAQDVNVNNLSVYANTLEQRHGVLTARGQGENPAVHLRLSGAYRTHADWQAPGGADKPGHTSNTGLRVLLGETMIETGSLHNGGLLRAEKLRLKASGQVENRGAIQAVAVDISTQGQLLNAGAIQGQALTLRADSVINHGLIHALNGPLSVQTQALSNTGALASNGQLSMQLGTYENKGSIRGEKIILRSTATLTLDEQNSAPQASSALQMVAPALSLRAPLVTTAGLALHANEGDLLIAADLIGGQHISLRAAGNIVNQGIVANKQGDMTLKAKQSINNTGTIRSAEALSVHAGWNIDNTDQSRLQAKGDMTLAANRKINNVAGSLISSGSKLQAQAGRSILNEASRIQSFDTMALDSPVLMNLPLLTGDVWVERDAGETLPATRYSQPYNGRVVTLEWDVFTAGQVVSTLDSKQGVIVSCAGMDINQSSRRPKKNLIINHGQIQSVDVMRVHGTVVNENLSRSVLVREYLEALQGPTTSVWDNWARYNPQTETHPSLYAFLDRALSRSGQHWEKIWGLYKYNRGWLGQTLANADFSQAPALARILSVVLGADWKAQPLDELAQRWQQFKEQDEKSRLDIRFYAEQNAHIASMGDIFITGPIRNGDPEQPSVASPVSGDSARPDLATVRTAGLLSIQAERAWIKGMVQHNGKIDAQNVLVDANDQDIVLSNDDELEGGIQAEQNLRLQGQDIRIEGSPLVAQNIDIDAGAKVAIIGGMQTTDGSRHLNAVSDIQAENKLSITARQGLETQGARLHADEITLRASQARFGEIRELSAFFDQTASFGLLSYALRVRQGTQDRGQGTEVATNRLNLDISGDADITGGRFQSEQVQGRIEGSLKTASSATHSTEKTQRDSLDLLFSAQTGVAGKVASFNTSLHDSTEGQVGDGTFSGAEAKLGLGISSSQSSVRATTHQNSQLDLGTGQLLVGNTLDVGGADINANPADPEGKLSITAANIESTKFLDTRETEHEQWLFFIGTKTTANSSLADVVTHVASVAKQAEQGREFDVALLLAQAAGDATNLLLNDTVTATRGVGGEYSQTQEHRKTVSENINGLNGNLDLTALKGNIDLIGAQFSGGQEVNLKANEDVNLQAARTQETASGSHDSASLYTNVNAGCNAMQAVCGVGADVSVTGANSLSQEEVLQHAHTRIDAQNVNVTTGRNLTMNGASIAAQNDANLDVGKDFTSTSLQDKKQDSTSGSSGHASVGAALNTATVITPTGSGGGSLQHEHDQVTTTSQISGVQAGNQTNVKVVGHTHLTGSDIIAQREGSTLDFQGGLSTDDIEDTRDHDGGHGGFSAGLSGSTGMPTVSISGGRTSNDQYASTHLSTVDVGQTTGRGKVAIDNPQQTGDLNTDAGQADRVRQDRHGARMDVQITITRPSLPNDPGRKRKTQPPAETPIESTPRRSTRLLDSADSANPDGYGKRFVVLVDDSPEARDAARKLADKHPETTDLLQFDGKVLQTLRTGKTHVSGPIKVQVVGHGGQDGDGTPVVGEHNAKRLADIIANLSGDAPTKVTLVSCNSGVCAESVRDQLRHTLPDTRIKGYEGQIDIDDAGRKIAVTDGGLGPKRSVPQAGRNETPDTVTAPKRQPDAEDAGTSAAPPPTRTWASVAGKSPVAQPPRAARPALRVPAVEESMQRVQDIRESMGIEERRNIGVARYAINGKVDELIAISGYMKRPGTVGVTQTPRFETIETGGNPRRADSEAKIFEYVARMFPATATGSLHIFTERPPCVSCSNMIPQFQQAFPGVQVIVTHGPRPPR